MALTPTEKQRRYREALKKKQEAAPDQSSGYLRRTFSDFLAREDETDQQVYSSIIAADFDAIGMQLPSLSEETDPEFERIYGEEARGAIGKAEVMVSVFRGAARMLAELVNRYKLEEIDARLAEIEGADLSDPATKKQAFADIVRLTEIRKRLDKEVRHSFREIRVKGE